MKDCVFLSACQYKNEVKCNGCSLYISKDDYLKGCAEVMREQYKEGVNQDG